MKCVPMCQGQHFGIEILDVEPSVALCMGCLHGWSDEQCRGLLIIPQLRGHLSILSQVVSKYSPYGCHKCHKPTYLKEIAG
jgi:hypothetical protein